MANIKRLKQGIAILKRVAEEKRNFNLKYWLNHEPEEQPKDDWCGTTACAAGYFALDPILSEQGLKLRIRIATESTGNYETQDIGSIEDFNRYVHGDTPKVLGHIYPVFGNYHEFYALREFFEISPSSAFYLFNPCAYNTINDPNIVIARMQEIIDEEEVQQ